MRLALDRWQYLEFEKIAFGAFAPLQGFMSRNEFEAVVETMHLPSGDLFPLPVVLDVPADAAREIARAQRVSLTYRDAVVGDLEPSDLFEPAKEPAAEKVFGTADPGHPGVEHFYKMGRHFVGGLVRLHRRADLELSRYELTPAETRAHFAARGWRTIVGFQTRNVPHRAHEHLQRLALEQADGLFIQPLVGRRKLGDYDPEAILAGYRVLIDEFLPAERVLLGVISVAMRYAGPREAIFHAIIRRNYGCTHFIVGRDHAGVGGYYGKYDAHKLAERFAAELGIEVLTYAGPFHCQRCGGIVTERTCPHAERAPEAVTHISGTDLRMRLVAAAAIPETIMRPEVVAAIRRTRLFIEEDDA